MTEIKMFIKVDAKTPPPFSEENSLCSEGYFVYDIFGNIRTAYFDILHNSWVNLTTSKRIEVSEYLKEYSLTDLMIDFAKHVKMMSIIRVHKTNQELVEEFLTEKQIIKL